MCLHSSIMFYSSPSIWIDHSPTYLENVVLNSIKQADLRLPWQKFQQGSCGFSCGVSSSVVCSSCCLKTTPTGTFYETPDAVNVYWACVIYNAEPLTALQ